MKPDLYRVIPLWIIRVCLFLAPFVPLYISRSLFFPFITGKAFIFRALVEISFAAWLFLAIRYKEFRPRLSVLLWAVAAFIFIVTLATVFSVNPFRSFWSNFERMEGLVSYLHLFGYFLVLRSVFVLRDWRIWFNLALVAGIIENIYAFLQRAHIFPSPQGGFRVDGTIGNPTYLAAYLIFIVGIALLLFFQTKNKILKWYYGAAATMTIVAIYFTATRGAAIGLVLGFFVAAILYIFFVSEKEGAERGKKRIAMAVLAGVIIICAGIWAARNTAFIKNSPAFSRLASFSLSERTVASRFIIWGMSFEAFKERPILGWGPENYPIVFSKYFKPALWRQEPWFDRSHNIIFDWLINAGLLGLLSYLSLFYAVIYLLWRKKSEAIFSREEQILLSSLFLVYFLQNIFVFDQIATYLMFFAIIAFIDSRTRETEGAVVLLKDKEKKGAVRDFAAGGAIVLVLAAGLYYVVMKPLSVNLNLLSALNFQAAGMQSAPQIFERFEKALAAQTVGRGEVREQLIRFAISAVSANEVPVDIKQKIAERAINEAKVNIAENPHDPRPVLFLGALYSQVGFFDDALKTFNEAIVLSPKKQQSYFELADVYIRRNDFVNAVRVLKTAYDLDPAFDQARINLAAVSILSGDQNTADSLLKEQYGTVEVPERLLAQVYARIKNYDRLVGIWKAFVASEPMNVDLRKNLAGAYLVAGDRNAAIRTLEEAIVAIPSFKNEGETLIFQIRSGKEL